MPRRLLPACITILVLIVLPSFSIMVYAGVDVRIATLFAVLLGIATGYVAAIINY